MNFNTKIFKSHAIAEVAIEPVGLFNDDDLTRSVLFQKVNHLAKLLSSSAFGGFHIHKLLKDLEALFKGVFTEHFQLSRNGKTLLLLILARHPCIDDCILCHVSILASVALLHHST